MKDNESLENNRYMSDLLLSEERLKMVLEGSEQGFWDWNLETDEVKRNDRWCQMLGYSTIAEFNDNTDSWTNSIHPDDRDAAWKSIKDHIKGLTSSHKMEYRMLTKDGGFKWILDHAKIVQRDSNGHPLRMSGTHIDITSRIELENKHIELLKSEAIFLAEREKHIIYRATVGAAQYILNNLLNNMLLFKMKAEKSDVFDDKTKIQFADSIVEGTELVKKLCAVEELTESNIKESVYPQSVK